MDKLLESKLDTELCNDDSPRGGVISHGGVMYPGETVRDFLFTVDRDEEITSLDELNMALAAFGIKPIK